MADFSSEDFAEFNRLLASVVERGIGLETAVDLLAGQSSRRRVREALDHVSARLKDGASLPAALESAPDLFPDDYRALVKAGSDAGRLAEVLRSTEDYHAMKAALAAQTRRLAMYVGAGLLLFVLIMTFTAVISGHWAGLYDALGMKELPESTLLVLAITRNAGSIMLVTGLVVLVAWGAYRFLRSMSLTSRMLYWIPIWGRLQRSRDLALLCSTVGYRSSGGAPMPEALRSASAALANRHARKLAEGVVAAVEQGGTLSSALYYRRWFPRTLCWGVSLGETRGDLPAVFEHFGKIYRSGVGRDFEMLHAVLTPLGVIVLGQLGLAAAMAIFLPIIRIQQHLGGP